MGLRVVIRGGGDLASGVGLRLVRAGWQIFILELQQPLSVRRMVSFSQAVYDGQITIEGVTGRKAVRVEDAFEITAAGMAAVIADPSLDILPVLMPDVLVDARMLKQEILVGQSKTK
jgi:xanthine dehydrogenase accessory factor